MAKKTDNSDELFDSPIESEAVTELTTEPIKQDAAEQGEAETPADNEARIWVYLGPSIRGVVINGRVFSGSKTEVIKSLESEIKQYPQIERLIVSDRNITKARNDMKDKRGIYIPYESLINKISGKEG